MANTNRNFNINIIERMSVLRTNPSGWTRELNLISWNNHPPKYDIREWSPDHTQMSKGITLTEEDAFEVFQALGKKFCAGEILADGTVEEK